MKVHKDNFCPINQIGTLFERTVLLPTFDYITRKVQKGLMTKARAEMERRNTAVYSRKLFSVYRYKKVTRSANPDGAN